MQRTPLAPRFDASAYTSGGPHPEPVYSCFECPDEPIVGENQYDMHTLRWPHHHVALVGWKVGGPAP